MSRTASRAFQKALLGAVFVANGCVLVPGDPCCPKNQSWCCHDDPRIGSCEFGCGWICPWEDLCEEIVIVGESGRHGCRPCASAIATDLEEQGIGSRIVGCHEVNLAARDLFAGRMSCCRQNPIIVVGCRGGVDDAIRLCRILESVGITVDKLVLVGNTCCACVPANIACCVNLFYSDATGLCGSGTDVCGAGHCTQVQNVDLSECGDSSGLCGCSDIARIQAVQHVLGRTP
ncbi:MAG: hypothetical protein ACT4QC_12355 [Planctomycetaceae bacterium]